MNSEETKENELRKMSNEFRLSNEFRSEGGKNVHSLYICPNRKGVGAAKSHFCKGVHSNQFTESLLRIYSIHYGE